jgi:hypothetical protein
MLKRLRTRNEGEEHRACDIFTDVVSSASRNKLSNTFHMMNKSGTYNMKVDIDAEVETRIDARSAADNGISYEDNTDNIVT